MRCPARLSYAVALVIFAALSGCATPQYQSSVRLIPPDDATGRACVQGCETRKTVCQTDCQSRFQACVKELGPQVEARYADALKQYEVDLKRYAWALRNYEMQLRYEWLNSYPSRFPYGGYPWPGPYYPPPYPEPVLPTRDGIQAQLEKSSCQADCGCLPAYDSCFVGCGGQRLSETRCIKNCPPAKSGD